MNDDEAFKTVKESYQAQAKVKANLTALRARQKEILDRGEDATAITARIVECEHYLAHITQCTNDLARNCEEVIEAEEELREKRAKAIQSYRTVIAYAEQHYPSEPQLPEWKAKLEELLKEEREDS